jgi:phytoene desaturase
VADAVAIWTHVAGQTTAEAPGPLAFVTAILHGVGAFLPTAGIGAVPTALAEAARRAGVEFNLGTSVAAIPCERGRALGVTTAEGHFLEADAVISSRNGVGTYLELAREAIPGDARSRLERLPLQSPGACAYLAVRGGSRPPYLHFRLPGGGDLCRLLVTPAAVVDGLARDGWAPARLIAPMAHDEARRLGPDGQRAYLDRILAEPWWREHLDEVRVLDTRTPADWASTCHLYRESMNPVMTARLMRAGRLAHRSPYVERLYLCGSSTHPGQWVSFCAISGVLAADHVLEDLA